MDLGKYLLHQISPESVNKQGTYSNNLSTPLSKVGFHWADFNEVYTLQAVRKDLPETPLTVYVKNTAGWTDMVCK